MIRVVPVHMSSRQLRLLIFAVLHSSVVIRLHEHDFSDMNDGWTLIMDLHPPLFISPMSGFGFTNDVLEIERCSEVRGCLTVVIGCIRKRTIQITRLWVVSWPHLSFLLRDVCCCCPVEKRFLGVVGKSDPVWRRINKRSWDHVWVLILPRRVVFLTLMGGICCFDCRGKARREVPELGYTWPSECR